MFTASQFQRIRRHARGALEGLETLGREVGAIADVVAEVDAAQAATIRGQIETPLEFFASTLRRLLTAQAN